MGTPKNYSVKILDRSDEPRIAEIMKKNPFWKRKHARDQAAREKFMRRIQEAAPGQLHGVKSIGNSPLGLAVRKARIS